jgi:BlaR1 peptidase M56
LRAARPVADTRLYKCLADKVHAFGLARVPELRWSPAVFVPVVVGIRRPVLLVPADASTWSDALLDAVFSHELAHVQRHDLLVQLGADVVRAFHWPNPLAWVAAARLHIERERAADDCVLAGGAKSSDYASHLLRLAEHARGQLALGAGAAMLGRSQLRQRLERLLRPRLGGKPGLGRAFVGRRTAVLLVFVAMTAALPVACLESAGTPGGAPARFVYQVDPAHADATAAVLARRLDALALEGVRITKAGDRLTVDVPLLPTARRAEVDRVLASSARLRLALVDSGAEYSRKLAAHVRSDVTAARAGITVEEEEWRRGEGGASFHDVYLVGPRAALAAYLRALPESLRPPSGRTLLFDQTKDPERQRTVLIDDSTAVTITRVADADVFAFGGSDGWFEVNVALDAADGARLEALTSANLGRRMAVIFDEADLWGAPMVQSPIGTRVSVTARGSRDEAEQLAAGFRAGGLPAPLQRIADR